MHDFDPALPFALLWDETRGGARLFTNPRAVIAGDDMQAGLAAMRKACHAEGWLAGGFSYEAGLALEARTADLGHGPSFFWFGQFAEARFLPADAMTELLDDWRAPVQLGALQPLVARDQWMAAVSRVQRHIAAGDIYQANLTFPAELAVTGHPLAIFAQLFRPDVAPNGGIVHDGAGRWWLSLSPELFFRLEEDGQLTARPMKGTVARGQTPEDDRKAARALGADVKNRAENLMITDLLRNDMARVAEAGSVRVSKLFAVETYPTVHQMTSTITARLGTEAGKPRDALDVLEALFPCGSITGAPKIRAMEIIAELEPHPRGIYCGAIGWIGPQAASASFNVPIRTLALDTSNRPGIARLGLGAGIVADSTPASEWDECLTKARFLSPSQPETLIETMRIDAGGHIPRLSLHLARLARSADHFGIRADLPELESALAALHPESASRLRLLLHADGHFTVELTDLPAVPAGPATVAILPLPLDPGDWRLAHKSNERDFHAHAHKIGGCFETIYERSDGLLTEGSFTNIFVEQDGLLLTSPVSLGLLPGTLRAELLASGRAREALLIRADVIQAGAEGRFFIGNSLRGLLPARID